MADISIPGLNSKYKTDELVKGLVDVEKVKLTKMEDSVKEFESKKKVWQSFNRKISTLRTSARTLFGFENPFSNKLVDSSDERLLTATATRDATEQKLSFTVLQTATADKFISPPLSNEERVPSGTYSFEVGDKKFSLNYRGGKLSDFASRVETKSDGLMKLTVVRDTPDSQVILFESSKPGISNKLKFTGDALTWALDKGILKPVETANTKISLDPSGKTPGVSALLTPGTKLSIPLSSPINVESGMFLEYTVSTKDLDPSSREPVEPPPPELPKTSSALYQGVEVKSFSSSVKIPDWKKPDLPPVVTDNNIGQFSTSGGPETLPPLEKGNQTKDIKIPLTDSTGTIASIDLANNNTLREVTISNMKVTDPRNTDGYTAVNSLSTAGNSLLDFNGINIERETNNIDDLIPGVILNLHKADKNEEVEVAVKPDVKSAKDEIIKFVYNYNQAMTEILILSSDNADIVNEIEYFTDDERAKALEDLGKFRGDITLMQLKNRLQRITSSSYPTSLERDLSMLSQIGISTNAAGGSGGSVNVSKLRGYLEINENILDESLQKNSPYIKQLFGQDTDGDLVIDSGVGFELDRFLNPYIQSGGILANKIQMIDKNIDNTNDDIKDYKKHLVDYEAELKRKYGNMEGMLNQLQSSSSSLDTFNQQGKN